MEINELSLKARIWIAVIIFILIVVMIEIKVNYLTVYNDPLDTESILEVNEESTFIGQNCAFIQIITINEHHTTCKISYSYLKSQYPSMFEGGTLHDSFIDNCPNNITYTTTMIGDLNVSYYEGIISMDKTSNCSKLMNNLEESK